MRVLLVSVLLLSSGALADDASARAKLNGMWKDDAGGKDAGVWTLEGKGDAVKVTYSLGDRKLTEFECGTTGRECEMKDSGRSAKVSVWFNGPKLVALETKGSEVIKRRFGVGSQDNTLELEVIPIVPQGKAETLHFTRVSP